MRRRSTPLAASTIMLATMVLAGCGTSAPQESRYFEKTSVEAESIGVGDAVFAAYLSPQTDSFANGSTTGHLVLVDPDGSVRSLATSGMDTARIRWTASGVHFSDRDNDYVLGAGLTTRPNPKTDLQEALFVDDGSETTVSLYNDGFTDDGYKETVYEHHRGTTSSHDVEGAFWVASQCGQTVVGVAEAVGGHASGTTAETSAAAAPRQEKILKQLSPEAAGTAVLGRHTGPESAEFAPDAPCSDGVVHYLGYILPPDGSPENVMGDLVLRSWDTTTGEPKKQTVVDQKGKDIVLPRDGYLHSAYDAQSIRDGELRWFAADGRVLATSLRNGQTRELVHTTSAINDGNDAQAAFRGDSLFVLDVPNEDQGEPIELVRYDLGTGVREHIVTVPELNGQRSVDLVLRQFAVNPQLDTGD